MDTSTLTLETENLCLCAITLAYKDETSIKENKAGTNLQMVVLNKETGDFLGCAGLHKIDEKTPELGIWIKKSAHGHGYGKEAMHALKSWADQNLNYDYILYPVDTRNVVSRRIPESLGGKITREYSLVSETGRKLHMVEYRIYHD